MSASMNALVLKGPGDLTLEQVSKPEASAGSVVVRVIAAPIWDYVVRSLPASNRRDKFGADRNIV
jgi:NADPH:quinone reductase-like Zn-dependent oxidoreductase